MSSKKSGFIAIAGRPNAGKSTLLNQVLQANLSIVTPKAQTTRERVLGILTSERGQIVFIDTPGVHKAKEGGINEFMMKEVTEALEGATGIWYLIDPASALKHEMPVIELASAAKLPVFVLLNKIDVRMTPEQRASAEKLAQDAVSALQERGVEVVGQAPRSISARYNKNVVELLEDTWKLLPEGPLYYPDEDMISDRPVRFFVAEKVREQLLLCLGEELPYSCAVEIENFDEASKPPRIEAAIHVERDSQKGMVIGKGGAKIKEIGSAARTEIEEFLGQKVFLGLRVNVIKDWSRDPDKLKKMGYALPPGRKSQKSQGKGGSR